MSEDGTKGTCTSCGAEIIIKLDAAEPEDEEDLRYVQNT